MAIDPKHLPLQMQLRREMHYTDGRKGKTNFKIEAEDFIAIGGVLIALMFGVAMIFGVVPINKLTVAIVGLSGVGAVVASM
jgi:hypothetical protein